MEIDGNEFSVVDVSEGGLRFQGPARMYPEPGACVVGTIEFSDGEQVEVAGTILRSTSNGSCILEFTKGLAAARIMDEQRRVIRNYRL